MLKFFHEFKSQLSNKQEDEVNILEFKETGLLFEDLEKISRLSNLKSLQISDSCLSTLNFLTNFKNLEELNLKNNNLTYIDGISQLSNLKTLNISGNPIKDILPLLTLGNLEELEIDDSNFNKKLLLIALQNLKTFNGQSVEEIKILESRVEKKAKKSVKSSNLIAKKSITTMSVPSDSTENNSKKKRGRRKKAESKESSLNKGSNTTQGISLYEIGQQLRSQLIAEGKAFKSPSPQDDLKSLLEKHLQEKDFEGRNNGREE